MSGLPGFFAQATRELLEELLQGKAAPQNVAGQTLVAGMPPATKSQVSTLADTKLRTAKLAASNMPSSRPLVRATAIGNDAAKATMPKVASENAIPAELRNQTKYVILGILGRGGMGSVYEALHVRMDRKRALKVINPELIDNAEAQRRFDDEIKTVAKLDHPNIARAYDAEAFGALQVIVMEFVQGKTLYELLQARGRFEIQEACRCIAQACRGLQYAHEQDLVHRDLKPQNLMLSEDLAGKPGIVKILDFGLAKVVSENTRGPGRTKTNMSMGTYEYIAPEQALDASRADIRADIYSLGCTLYYMIAGVLPFPYDSEVKILLSHQNEIPRPLHEVRPEVPKALSALVDRMLAKKREDRPQTPAEVAAALSHFAGGKAEAGDDACEVGAAAASGGDPALAGLAAEIADARSSPSKDRAPRRAAKGGGRFAGWLAKVFAKSPRNRKSARDAAWSDGKTVIQRKPRRRSAAFDQFMVKAATIGKNPITWVALAATVVTAGAVFGLMATIKSNSSTKPNSTLAANNDKNDTPGATPQPMQPENKSPAPVDKKPTPPNNGLAPFRAGFAADRRQGQRSSVFRARGAT